VLRTLADKDLRAPLLSADEFYCVTGLSALVAGARIVLPDRCSAHAFWPLVRAHTVTWYSAVPTIHQILLARAASDNADSLHRRSYASLA